MPDRHPTRARRWWARIALLAVVASIAVIGPTTPAAAHGQLVFAVPAEDSTIDAPIDSVSLYFTERPASNAFFTIIGPDGRRVDHGWSGGEPKQLDQPVQEYFLLNGAWEPRLYSTGFPVLVRLAHWPAAGRYTVTYLSVASDGEEVKGEVSLTYTGPATSPPAGWQPPTTEPDPNLLTALRGASGGPATGAAGDSGVGRPASTAGSTAASWWWVWMLPAVLVAGVIILVVRAGLTRPPASRRMSARGKPGAPRASGGKGPSAATSKAKPSGVTSLGQETSGVMGSGVKPSGVKTSTPKAAGPRSSSRKKQTKSTRR